MRYSWLVRKGDEDKREVGGEASHHPDGSPDAAPVADKGTKRKHDTGKRQDQHKRVGGGRDGLVGDGSLEVDEEEEDADPGAPLGVQELAAMELLEEVANSSRHLLGEGLVLVLAFVFLVVVWRLLAVHHLEA
jgi:hypothetical protein